MFGVEGGKGVKRRGEKEGFGRDRVVDSWDGGFGFDVVVVVVRGKEGYVYMFRYIDTCVYT